VARVARERVTIDLRGLAPALKAQARAHRLSVSQAARPALLAALPLTLDAKARPADEPYSDGDRLVKLTIRLNGSVAAQLCERAWVSGLSHGAYLATLIEGRPAPPLAVAKALAESTDQLATVAADASEMLRLLRKDASPLEEEVRYVVRGLVDGTSRHLEPASRLVAELRPARRLPIEPTRLEAPGRRAQS
jgi:hypothetical protein